MDKNRGFTMIELIIVIAITSIVAATSWIFIIVSMNGYKDEKARAALADSAYSAIASIRNDVRGSLPNSVRVTTNGSVQFLEMLEISGGGEYRVQQTSTGTGDVLDFNASDSSFDSLGPPLSFAGGEEISIGNYGMAGLDAYAGDVMTPYAGSVGAFSNVKISPKQFPLDAQGHKFYVVTEAITYACDPTTGTLTKYWGYSPQQLQPSSETSSPLSSAANGLSAKYVSGCGFAYSQGANSRNAVVDLFLTLKNGSNSVTLYGDAYVPNT